MPETPAPGPLTIPLPPAEPILSRRTPPPGPSSGRTAEEEHELRHFALALAVVFAPAAILLSLAMLPGP